MVKRTRLYQRARSPLIQGHSKRERPLWQPLAASVSVALVAPLFLWWLITMIAGAQPAEALALLGSDIVALLLPMMPGAILGAVAGVLGARSWGSRRPWLPGAILGAVLAGAGLLLFG
ncbi:MAG: hypothetical protein D9V44_02250 [Actinobacteria bacterium]|nr:MAG: hypothetical protein D9V44_02250 [Actinomycetota bacterium]